MIIDEKYSEIAFKKCLELLCSSKFNEDMNFSKTGTKTLTFGSKSDLLQIYREREGETNRIFGVNGFEFYEVF